MSRNPDTASQLVVVDTCSWLDLVRLAHRGRGPGEMDAAAALMDRVDARGWFERQWDKASGSGGDRDPGSAEKP